jgi:hypothetical protein
MPPLIAWRQKYGRPLGSYEAGLRVTMRCSYRVAKHRATDEDAFRPDCQSLSSVARPSVACSVSLLSQLLRVCDRSA